MAGQSQNMSFASKCPCEHLAGAARAGTGGCRCRCRGPSRPQPGSSPHGRHQRPSRFARRAPAPPPRPVPAGGAEPRGHRPPAARHRRAPPAPPGPEPPGGGSGGGHVRGRCPGSLARRRAAPVTAPNGCAPQRWMHWKEIISRKWVSPVLCSLQKSLPYLGVSSLVKNINY